MVKRALKAVNLAGGSEGVSIGRAPLKLMCSRLSKFKDSLITPEEAPARIEAMIGEARQTDTPMEVLEAEAAWRHVPLPAALEIAGLPPKARTVGLAFADAIRGVGRDCSATLADQLSLLLDAIGYRAMLRESRAETTEGRLENVRELIQLACSFHTARATRPCRPLDRRPERGRHRARAADDAAQGQEAGVPGTSSCRPGNRVSSRRTTATRKRNAGSPMWRSRVACDG